MAPAARRRSMRLVEKAAAAAAGSASSSVPNKGASNEPAERPPKRDSIGSVASTAASAGRVKKPERKARVVASRYMASAKPRKAPPTPKKADTKPGLHAVSTSTPNTTATRQGPRSTRSRPEPPAAAAARPAPTRQTQKAKAAATTTAKATATTAAKAAVARGSPVSAGDSAQAKPQPRSSTLEESSREPTETPVGRAAGRASPEAHAPALASSGSHESRSDIRGSNGATGLYASYIQWCLIEARSQMEFEEARAAASEDLSRLVNEAEQANQALVDEQRKLKLMREISALSIWLAENRQHLVDMRSQIARVRAPYTAFGESLAQTTRAMPIADVCFDDCESLVGDIEKFADAVAQCFPKDSPRVRDVFLMAGRLRQYYRALRHEQELLSECSRLKQSLEFATTVAVSKKLGAGDRVV
ncbi:hypothetical protein GQ54DRAFT_142634 [Martensiomyces pterosporus]|nr:hypothetical protein GQ54DRAFT_142634 [Martensiomyces pterosporus]